MIELIGTSAMKSISEPCEEVVSLLTTMRQNTRGKMVVAEIGLGIGATTCKILSLLHPGDTLHLFDFQEIIDAILVDFANVGLAKDGIEIRSFGNTKKYHDSYVWSLAKIALERKKQGESLECYDIAYLDGSHTFIHDYPAAMLLKSLIKPNGYLILDDVCWRHAKSPTSNPVKAPWILNFYTEEQVNTAHVEMVVQLAMEDDPAFTRISGEAKAPRAVFRKNSENSYQADS
jgi:hypothetical protein